MRNWQRLAGAVLVGLGPVVLVPVAAADPVTSPNTLLLEMSCGGAESELYVTPASGSAVLSVNGTENTITKALTVDDPLNEIGGSFSIPLAGGIPLRLLTECSGTVVGTQAVTFTALSLIIPAGPG
jgi:hypothetical protein